MSATVPFRDPQECREKQALIDQVRAVINLIASIHNDELKAVLDGDFGAGESTQKRLQDARELKGLLIELLQRHVTEHAC
jgi:hypothetical protein